MHIVKQHLNCSHGCLTDKEWQELVTLEYVLTWHYSDDMNKDDKRYKELSNKRWVNI